MKNFICHFLTLSTIFCFAEIPLSHHDHQEIDHKVEELLALLDVPGTAVGIVSGGKTILAKGYGLRNKEKRLPVTPKTVFQVGSASKAFTSFLIGQLIDENLLKWDDPVSDHIPYFKLKDPHTTYDISIRDYLTHTSGYPRHEGIWFNQTLPRSEVIQKLRFLDPIYSHREKFYYPNIGYMIVGHVAECVTNKSYETLIDEKIFKPLGMAHSTFSFSSMLRMDNFALSYNELSQLTSLVDPTTIAPAGGMNSNLEDLLKWIKLLLNSGDDLIERSTFNEMIKPQVVADLICNGLYGLENEIVMESYGLGWMLLSYRGHFLVLHGGSINGFSSVVLFLPNEDIGIVILSNKDSSPLPFLLASILMDKLLELPAINWPLKYKELLDLKKPEEPVIEHVETEPSHIITDYLGTYSHPGYGSIELRLIKNGLTAVYNNLHIELNHSKFNTFEISNKTSQSFLRGIKFTFQENDYGDIKAVSIPWEPKLQGIIFMKDKDPSLTDKSYLNKFAGNYSYLGFTVSIQQTDSKLVAKAFGQPPFELYPERPNQFKVKDMEGYRVEFLTNETGAISAIQMTQPNNSTYTARKI